MRELKEHLSKEGIEFIQQSCKQEECAPCLKNEMYKVFVTEEAKEEILKWGTDVEDLLLEHRVKYDE